ncbi:hypothetical protein PRZ48_013059 [Zasmidium cellare]|uniref:Uncharacterized protein n=1 Tax=Zasmidium cellare TaxID=395010 RepID=A0ABR0E3J5_ZASCE|nr:hypothetical protein PRZ48_013059 [Zasmidium cellare]
MADTSFSVEALMRSSQIFQRGDDVALVPKHSKMPHQQNPIAVDSVWVTTYNGNLWPVVISDEAGPPQGFLASRRGKHEIPAILLGRHKYIWVSGSTLRAFDPHHDYLAGLAPFSEPEIQNSDSDSVKVEKQRRVAFRQDADMFEKAGFWHTYIKAKSQARKVQAELDAQEIRKRSQTTPKRRRSGEDKYSSGTRKRHGTHDRSYWKEAKGLATPVSSSNKRSRNALGPGYDHLFPDDDEEMESPIKKRSSGTFEREDRRMPSGLYNEGINDVDEDESSLFMPQGADDPYVSKHRTQTAPQSFIKREPKPAPPPMGPDMCRVLIDANPEGTIIPLTALDSCIYLLQRQTINKTEHIVDLREDPRAKSLGLTERQFRSIYEYLHTGEIVPEITPATNVEELSEKTKVKSAGKLASAFVAASKIEHEYLLETIQQKFMLLHPLPTLAIPTVARDILSVTSPHGGTKIEKYLRAWIIDHVAYDFWDLCPMYSGQIQSLMAEHGLAGVILGKVTDKMEAEKKETDKLQAAKIEAQRIYAEKTASRKVLPENNQPRSVQAENTKTNSTQAENSQGDGSQDASKKSPKKTPPWKTGEPLKPLKARVENVQAAKTQSEMAQPENVETGKAEAEKPQTTEMRAEKVVVVKTATDQAENAQPEHTEKSQPEEQLSKNTEPEKSEPATTTQATETQLKNIEPEKIDAERSQTKTTQAAETQAGNNMPEKTEAEKAKADNQLLSNDSNAKGATDGREDSLSPSNNPYIML